MALCKCIHFFWIIFHEIRRNPTVIPCNDYIAFCLIGTAFFIVCKAVCNDVPWGFGFSIKRVGAKRKECSNAEYCDKKKYKDWMKKSDDYFFLSHKPEFYSIDQYKH